MYLLNRYIPCTFGRMKIMISPSSKYDYTPMDVEEQNWSDFPLLDPGVQIWSIPIIGLED